MFSLRRQVLLLLGVTLGSLLTAKTLVDFSRSRPAVEDAARARGQLALLQARALLEHSATDGSPASLRRLLSPLAASPGVEQLALLRPDGTVLFSNRPELEQRFASGTSLGPLLGLDLKSGELKVSGDALLAASPVRLPLLAPAPPPEAAAPTPAAAPPGTARSLSLVLQLDLAGPLGAARMAALVENGVTLVVVVLVLAFIGWLLEARLGGPVRRIVAAIEEFDRGERGARTGLRGPDEIGGLARAFDAMAERMQTAEAHLLDTQTALDGLLKALPVGVLVVKRDDGRPYYVNPRWRELFGIHLEAHRDILAILSTVRCERPDGSPYPIEQQPITAVLRTGEPAEARDLCVRHDDRVVRLVAHAVPVSLTHAGSFEAVLVIAREAEATEAATATRILAPETTDAMATEPAAPATSESALDDPTLPTVMLVEADRTTCVQAASALRAAGYRVLVAEDGARALSLLRNEAPRIEVIVLDLAIEAPGGGTVLDDLLRFDPAARVIAASGYRADLPDLAASGKVTAFMTRPYGPDRVVHAVREAIGAPAELERAFAP